MQATVIIDDQQQLKSLMLYILSNNQSNAIQTSVVSIMLRGQVDYCG